MPLAPGDRVGAYDIIGPLGAGGMGEVYKATDTRLRRSVALKLLPAIYAADSDRLRRFQQEALATAALNHPNILAVYDVGSDGHGTYLVSELLEGHTLRDLLRNGALPIRKALDYAVQIVNGLAAAHEKGIVHRDLKPENLFITKDGRVKILDFGLAKLHRALDPDVNAAGPTVTVLSDPGVVLGTVGYMSPEQVRGAHVDYRSDMFSFGTILYEMLTGTRAFRRSSSVETMTAILKEDPPELTELAKPVSPLLARIVRRCLEKDSEHRFRSAQDLAFALEASSGSGSSATLSPATPTPSRRWLVGALAAACTVPLILWAGYSIGRQASAPVHPDRPIPTFQRLTFRRGGAPSARFTPDGKTVVYAAAWDGDPVRVFSRRMERPESFKLDLPDAGLEAVSSSSELLIMLGRHLGQFWETGTLARVPIGGGAPRPLLNDALGADWGPDDSIATIRRVNNRYRLEYPEGHVLYESADGLNSPRVSRNGDQVAFWALEGGHNAVDVVSRKGVKRTLSGGWDGVGRYLVWSPSGDEVWFSAAAPNSFIWDYQLRAVSLSGVQRVLLRLPATLYPQDVSPNGKELILGVGALRQVSRCLPPGESHERDLSWFGSTSVSDISGDGRIVLLNESVGARVQGGNVSYVRNVNESTPLKVADGGPVALSPDGRWVVVQNEERFTIVPTGAGETRPLDTKGLDWVWWYPDNRHLLLSPDAPDSHTPCVEVDRDTAARRPLTPDGVVCRFPPSPDGRQLLLKDKEGRWQLYVLPHGPMRAIRGVGADDVPLQWAEDSRSLFVQRQYLPVAKIDRVELATGKSQPARDIVLADSAGFNPTVSHLAVSPNGAYCYSYLQGLTELYAVQGIQ
jgi:serine/threonine protein kinase